MNKLSSTSIALSILLCCSSAFASSRIVVGKGFASTLHSDFENFAKALAEQDALRQCAAGGAFVDPATWKMEYEQGFNCKGRGFCDPDVITGIRVEALFRCEGAD